MKDPAVPRDDLYKSGTIHTGPGESPNSVSRPTPRPKQIAARPVTKGKLLRPGGPNGGPSKLSGNRPNGTTPRPVPTPQALPAATPAATRPTPARPRIVPQPVVAATTPAAAGHRHTSSQASVRAPPPPPPAPPAAVPAAPQKPTAKVLYDFSSGRANELTIHAGEVVQIVSKEGNGLFKPQSTFCIIY
jgi:myosin I